MTDTLRIAIAQLNQVVGDIPGNLDRIRAARARAAEAGADLVITPELSVVGYPPEDLLQKPAFVWDAADAVQALAAETADGGPALIVGAPEPLYEPGFADCYNAVYLLDAGGVSGVTRKTALPNYGVFDEKRVFHSWNGPAVAVEWRGVRLGLPICEDIWQPHVPTALMRAGAQLLICINGSPWRRTIDAERAKAFAAWRDENAPPLIFVNQVGGQDELVFDGASFSWCGTDETVQRLPAFETAFAVQDWRRAPSGRWTASPTPLAPQAAGLEADYRAAALAVGDYVDKNGFPGVVLGLSGGVDSALTAAIAADALGPERVWCVMMPSRYTSVESLEDAQACADALGLRLTTIPIDQGVAAFDGMLAESFAGTTPGVSEENIQSRLRGVLLMALSNKFGPMVLTTGNKSEMAVGYATLYGDMNGGYNALKDLYKTEVYALARWRNANRPEGLKGAAGVVIPERILTKAPSAELRPDQTDQDSLPSYEVLDDILRGIVDREEEVETVIARGHDPQVVSQVQRLVYLAEYKRRQAPPGAKIGGRNFGRDRRYPITNKYRDAVPDGGANRD